MSRLWHTYGQSFPLKDFGEKSLACTEYFRKRIVELGLLKTRDRNTDTPKIHWSGTGKSKYHYVLYCEDKTSKSIPKKFYGGTEGNIPQKVWDFVNKLHKDEKRGVWVLTKPSDENEV